MAERLDYRVDEHGCCDVQLAVTPHNDTSNNFNEPVKGKAMVGLFG